MCYQRRRIQLPIEILSSCPAWMMRAENWCLVAFQPPTRLRTGWWAFLCVAVALSVFGWGLQYKLSLYDLSRVASSKVPIAKLLSKNEQQLIHQDSSSASAQPAKAIAPASFDAVLLFLTIACVAGVQAPVWLGRHAESSLPPQGTILRSLFIRPPPASLW